MITRIALAFMWVVHFLPARAVAAIGNVVGSVLFWLIPERRRVTRINLEKCFPEMPPRERERMARAHFRAFCRAFIERGILWWSPPGRIARLVKIEGREHLDALEGRPVILFAPHFAGLDAAVTRLSMDYSLAGIYSKPKDAVLDALIVRGRGRFKTRMFPRHGGMRGTMKAIKEGMRCYFLPDLDYGPRGSVFVPFFGVPAAATTGLAQMARATRAFVVPVATRMLPRGGYVVRLYPAWTDYPSGNDEADARRMLAFIEERVPEMPEQYHWLHRRFKTRPQGEAKFY